MATPTKRIVKKNHVLGHLVQSITQHHRASIELHCYLSNLSNRAIYKSVCLSISHALMRFRKSQGWIHFLRNLAAYAAHLFMYAFAINGLLDLPIFTLFQLSAAPILYASSKLQQADVEDQQGIHAQGRQVAVEGVPDQNLGGDSREKGGGPGTCGKPW